MVSKIIVFLSLKSDFVLANSADPDGSSLFAIDYVPIWEHSGSVVECLTRYREAAGLSQTRVTVLCP